jgi:hypothetical protein
VGREWRIPIVHLSEGLVEEFVMTRRALLVGLVTLALAAWTPGPVAAED